MMYTVNKEQIQLSIFKIGTFMNILNDKENANQSSNLYFITLKVRKTFKLDSLV